MLAFDLGNRHIAKRNESQNAFERLNMCHILPKRWHSVWKAWLQPDEAFS